MSIFGHTFLAKTQPSLANWAEHFYGTQETVIYRLVVRNPSYDAYILVFDFLGHFWQDNGRGNHAHP